MQERILLGRYSLTMIVNRIRSPFSLHWDQADKMVDAAG